MDVECLTIQKQNSVFNYWRIRHMCLITTAENSRIDFCLHAFSSEVYPYAAKNLSFYCILCLSFKFTVWTNYMLAAVLKMEGEGLC